MSAKPGYRWRKMTLGEREEVLGWRKRVGRPWHGPPHEVRFEGRAYHLSAACYEHEMLIGWSLERMEAFSAELLKVCAESTEGVGAWCVLRNHYHVLVQARQLALVVHGLGKLHGRMARAWNLEEGCTGRQVFHRAADRAIRSERHFWATVNYIHHNPVHHGYVEKWEEWARSSAGEWLERVGREEAVRIWREYPVREYGAKWDGRER